MPPVLEARKLTKCFDGFCAVNAVDFSVDKNHCFGFLGPNGAGKTTTIKMLYGALSPTSGEVILFGESIRKNRRKAKRRIGVVQQKDILEESLSARDNLKIHGRHFGFGKDYIKKRSDDLLDLLQLSERSDEPVFRYSGGMKRRLSIAKGLLNEPELLLLDEPTTGLDPQARHLLWKTLGLIKENGTSILLTTHYMHEAEFLCDNLVVIDCGKIIEEGEPQALITKHQCKNLEEVFLKLTGRELRNE